MKNNKKNTPTFKTAEVITLVIITCVVSLLMGLLINKPTKQTDYKLADEEIQNFIEQYNYIVDNYYDEVDKEKLLDAALKGMINSLGDPYSNYLDETTSSTFNSELNGVYNGIGIEIINNGTNIIVSEVFENTPASKAGIQALDLIVSVNGQAIDNMSTSEFVKLIQNDDTFKLELKRGEETRKVTVTKEKITLSSVSSEIIKKESKKIGYMYISIFAMNTDSQFKKHLEDLESNGIDSLIIDLRGNSGGHLTTVENMISLFLDSSNIIYQIENKSKITKYYSKGKETKKYPIVVLINQDSASAAEMMAASLKESYGATLVGTNTYGKGTVQELQNNNNSQYKITTKKWLTPKGNWINEVGISPDIEIKLTEDNFYNLTKERDNQFQKALEILLK